MNKDDIKKDFLQPILNTKEDYDAYIVDNHNRKVRDETIEESADRYVWIHAGGAKPKSYDDPFIKKIDTMARLPQVNKLVDQKLQGNKTLNYINQNKNMYQKEHNKMLPTNTKLADVPILKRNIKYPKPVKTNPTIERYKNFKEEQKFKEEELKFNKEFDKEYSHAAMEKDMLAKENKNIREGKAPHAGFTSSDQIIAVTARDKAKEQLDAIKAEHVKLKASYTDDTSYIDDVPVFKNTGPRITLDEHMAKAAPRVMDEPGITALKGVRNFRNIVDTTQQKFPKKARGIGPLISGEDD